MFDFRWLRWLLEQLVRRFPPRRVELAWLDLGAVRAPLGRLDPPAVQARRERGRQLWRCRALRTIRRRKRPRRLGVPVAWL